MTEILMVLFVFYAGAISLFVGVILPMILIAGGATLMGYMLWGLFDTSAPDD